MADKTRYTANLVSDNNIFSDITNDRVGIGTTVPTSKLDVRGDGNFTGVVTASSFSGNASSATYATNAGIATYATSAGVATALQNSRTFEITGDIIASPISFNGTGNVSLAATIQPNSVALGNDTTGDYIQSISGTSNQITVTGGTGEGSTPTLSVPNQFTAPQDVTVTRDLQVNRNLNVTGNITIGGTSATIFSQTLNIFDPDIVLGYRTDGSGNDISNDNTANHGGVAIASTEGTPLVQLFIAGIETNPATYKKIMWFKSGTFSGLGTDAWLSNYAVGIGSTQFPVGTRLAAGSVQFTERDLAVVRNINASGIITGTLANTLTLNTSGTGLSGSTTYNNSGAATFTVTSNATSNNTPSTIVARDGSGNFSAGTITANLTGTASTASFATTAFNLSDAANITTGTINSARLSGTYNISINGNAATATYATNAGIATYATSAGIATYASNAGIATYATSAGVSTSVIGGIGSLTQLSVSGVSTFSGITTHTASLFGTQASFTGVVTASSFSGNASSATYASNATYATSAGIATYATSAGIATYATTAGIATYATSAGIATYASNAGIATYASNAGVSTSVIGGIGSITQLQVTGLSTFTNGPVFIGTATSTGTASQPLQVTGGAYVSGNLGIGTTNPTSKLDVRGAINLGGAVSIIAERDSGNNDVIYFNPLNESRVSIGINTTLNWSSVSGTPDVAFVADNSIFGFPKIAIANPTVADPHYALYAAYSTGIVPYGYIRQELNTASYAIALDNGPNAFSVGDRTSLDSSRTSNFSSGNEAFVVTLNGSTSLFHSKSKKFETSGVGVTVYGNLNVGTGGTVITTTASGLVGIGTTNPSQPLHVQGNTRVTGAVYDSTNSPGTSGQVLQSTVTGTQWTTAAAGGGSGTFDTGITTSVFISAISGVGINTAQNNDIFVGPGIAGTASGIGLSFPSTASREYVIESIHVTNTYSNELYLNVRHDFNTGSNTWRAVPIAQRLVVPYQGSVEIINQPMVANPNDHFRFQALAGVGATATGIDGGLDVFMVYSEKTDTNFVGVGSTVASISGEEVYRSTTYPSVIQSIRLCNYNLNIDVDASVSIYRGGTAGGIVTTGVRLGYLVYNMTIPKNSIIEILEKPKYLAINDTIVAVGSTINSLSACVSAKLIV